MHNIGSFHVSDTDIFEHADNLKRRDFLGALFKVGGEKCVEYLGDSIKMDSDSFKFCRNEVMVAASCVLMSKVNVQMGDNRDNVGLCKFEINLAKEKLIEKYPEFPTRKMDDWFRDLSFSTKSFV